MMDFAAFHAVSQGVLMTRGRGWAEKRLALWREGAEPVGPHPAWLRVGCGVTWALFEDRGAYRQADGRYGGVTWMPVDRGVGLPVITVPLGGADDPADLFAFDPLALQYSGLVARTGAGVLGDWQLLEIAEGGHRVRLHWSPADWLRAGGGQDRLACPELADEPPRVCVFDWDSWQAHELLDHAGELVCDDQDHAADVEKILAAHRKAKLGPKPALMVAA